MPDTGVVRDGAQKPAVLLTGVSGNLGLRLLEFLPDFKIIGVDVREPETASGLAEFAKIDFAEERSCNQLLELMRRHRPEALVHLAFVVDPLRSGVLDGKQMWQINVAGTGRVIEAVAEYNRMLGGLHKFIFPSSVSVYGPDLPKAVSEDAPLQARSLPYALHKRETDLTVQARVYGMKCKTYILRPAIFVGPTVRNYLIGVLRGDPGGSGALARRMRRRNQRLPLLLPSGGAYLEHKFQFVHVDDMARLIAHILRRKQSDPKLSIMNVAGRGDPIALQACARIASAAIKRLPGRALCRLVLRLLWKLGISDVPPEALPYLLGSYVMETARLRVFLGEDYRKVIHYTCEEALATTFRHSPASAQKSVAT
jgi:nucleoside-diphosphate-sugar epimerase